MPSSANVRVRFAPSPTGDVHIGGIWLAQIDWLFATQHHGRFVLRLEDTDQKRSAPGAADKLYQALEWYGLTPDEGPQQGGRFGPYVQSQRLDHYQHFARQLIEQGSAYYCFCTPTRLTELRQAQQAAKQPPRYDKRCAVIPVDEARRRVTSGEPAVVRLNVPSSGLATWTDLIRGQVTFRYDQIDDSVLLKSDGFPTYHLAVVVDDHLMEISHVLRAEEWLSSTPKHLWLYKSLGWSPPHFAHLPQILGQHKKKLSKREGAVAALYFRDQGYLPEAMQNFLALMGWHPKGDDEVLSRQQVLKQFDVAEVNPSGAVFDQAKLDWLNGSYIRALSLTELLERVRPFWQIPHGQRFEDTWLRQALSLIKQRMKTLRQVNDINTVFSTTWDQQRASFDLAVIVPKKSTIDDARDNLEQAGEWLTKYEGEWLPTTLKTWMVKAIATAGKTNSQILWPVRVALSLQAASPDVFDLLGLLGRTESLRRIMSFAKASRE